MRRHFNSRHDAFINYVVGDDHFVVVFTPKCKCSFSRNDFELLSQARRLSQISLSSGGGFRISMAELFPNISCAEGE